MPPRKRTHGAVVVLCTLFVCGLGVAALAFAPAGTLLVVTYLGSKYIEARRE